MQQKIAQFHLPRGFSIMPVLIHVNGVSEAVIDAHYFSHLVDFTEIFR